MGEELSGVRSWPDRPDPRERILAAVIELAGASGVGNFTLASVLERAGVGHRAFHRHFDSIEAAVEYAYEERAAALVADLLGVGLAAEDWQAGFRAAVVQLVAWAEAEPATARLLLVEYRAAPRTFELHEQGAEALARAIDLGRRERGASDPPQMTAALAIGAIESQLSRRLRLGREGELGDLVALVSYFGVLLYLGPEAAARELG